MPALCNARYMPCAAALLCISHVMIWKCFAFHKYYHKIGHIAFYYWQCRAEPCTAMQSLQFTAYLTQFFRVLRSQNNNITNFNRRRRANNIKKMPKIKLLRFFEIRMCVLWYENVSIKTENRPKRMVLAFWLSDLSI